MFNYEIKKGINVYIGIKPKGCSGEIGLFNIIEEGIEFISKLDVYKYKVEPIFICEFILLDRID